MSKAILVSPFHGQSPRDAPKVQLRFGHEPVLRDALGQLDRGGRDEGHFAILEELVDELLQVVVLHGTTGEQHREPARLPCALSR